MPALIPLLADADPDVRWTAARALGAVGPKAAKAVPALTKALRDENADVREGARVAIEKVQAAG